MTLKRKKKTTVLAVIAVALIALIVWTLWGNTALELNKYIVSSERIPEDFNGYRIAQVSDLHNTELGEGNEKLLSMLNTAKPDIIAIIGDLIDAKNTDIDIALRFAEDAVAIAPCYFVTGNHESRSSNYNELKEGLTRLGVAVLENEQVELERNGKTISLLGVTDPRFHSDYMLSDETIIRTELDNLVKDNDNYTVLLSHRPEQFSAYVEKDIDLVLSGHAHGGQFRLPFAGGIVAPNQGLFPKYDAGLFTEKSTNMVVSKGIGNSIIPLRFCNRPEVVLIELQHK